MAFFCVSVFANTVLANYTICKWILKNATENPSTWKVGHLEVEEDCALKSFLVWIEGWYINRTGKN